ncbi:MULTISPECIES: type VII secretion target [Actinoplanes]|uniref:type VII secretion target n=1 Tax=Actinoplanes TaxID=1865 RepID=UPI0005F2DA5D|nr:MULTISPECIES: type VII secretion target [Actinoplanes]GLY02371.1 hypothetical protein Acsp01_27500 [Actinoplanes sp. NBRC 101535]
MAELDLDEKLLRSIAAGVADAAGTLQSGVKAAGTGLAPSSQTGSAAFTAVQAAERTWLTELGSLQSEIGGFSVSLKAAADEYSATDHDNADDLRNAANGAP